MWEERGAKKSVLGSSPLVRHLVLGDSRSVLEDRYLVLGDSRSVLEDPRFEDSVPVISWEEEIGG